MCFNNLSFIGENPYIHCPPKVKVQPALFIFFSFVHNSSINELKNMKSSEHICHEMIH